MRRAMPRTPSRPRIFRFRRAARVSSKATCSGSRMPATRPASSAAAAGRGVEVRVLLDGSPVGGVEEDEHRVVGGLLAAGVDVRWLAGAPDVVKRYRYHHAKYAIVDGRVAWIGSENFGNAGFPSDREGTR